MKEGIIWKARDPKICPDKCKANMLDGMRSVENEGGGKIYFYLLSP